MGSIISESEQIPSDNVQLNHLFPIQLPEIFTGHWSPGKIYLFDPTRERKAFVIDEIGHFVWNLCDGKHSVRKIEKLLIEEAQQDKTGVRASTATFLLNLKKKGYISLEQREG